METNNSSLTKKELGEFVKSYGSLAEAAQKAAEAVSNVSEAAIVPDGTVETLKLVSEMYKTVAASAVSLGSISTETLGIVAGAAAGAAAAIASVFDNLSIKLEQEWDLVSESARAIYNQAAAYDDVLNAAEENIEKAKENAEAAKSYWEIIQELVDENGRAKGSTDKLQAAVAQLNGVAGTNVEVINGQIVGYKELSNVIGDTIEKTRIAAQKSYLWDSYGEAVFNIDDVEKQYEEAKKEREELAPIYNEKYYKWFEADYALNNFNGLIFDPAKYGLTDYDVEPLKEAAKEAEKAFNEAQDRENALEQQLNSYREAIKKFEALSEEEKNLNDPYAGKTTTEIERETYEKRMKESAELAKLGVEKTWDDLKDTILRLDDELAVHNISDNTYWDLRLRYLEASRYEENKEWWAYYDETIKHFNNLSEAEKKAYEDQIRTQADALKEKKELNDEYTEEMYLNDLENLISTLDKESDLYQKYNSEILKGRKALSDSIAKETAESRKAQVTAAAQMVKEVQSEYSKMLSDVLNEQESYKNKLMGITKLYTVETESDDDGNDTQIFTLENIDKQIKAVEDYDNKLKKLKERGIGEGLTSYMEGLSQEDSENMMKALSDMSDDELKAYSDKYDKLMETINERAESRYAPQVEEINNGFINKVMELMGQLPAEMQRLGVDSINSFVRGFTGDNSTFIATMSDKLDEMFDGFNDDTFVETAGQNVGNSSASNSVLSRAGGISSDIFAVRDRIRTDSAYQSGGAIAIRYMDGFEDELDRSYEHIIAERNLTVSGMTAGQQLNSFNYYGTAPQQRSNSEKIVLENKETVTVNIDKEVLGKTMLEWTKEYERKTGR